MRRPGHISGVCGARRAAAVEIEPERRFESSELRCLFRAKSRGPPGPEAEVQQHLTSIATPLLRSLFQLDVLVEGPGAAEILMVPVSDLGPTPASGSTRAALVAS
jgi:hypothetical protein